MTVTAPCADQHMELPIAMLFVTAALRKVPNQLARLHYDSLPFCQKGFAPPLLHMAAAAAKWSCSARRMAVAADSARRSTSTSGKQLQTAQKTLNTLKSLAKRTDQTQRLSGKKSGNTLTRWLLSIRSVHAVDGVQYCCLDVVRTQGLCFVF